LCSTMCWFSSCGQSTSHSRPDTGELLSLSVTASGRAAAGHIWQGSDCLRLQPCTSAAIPPPPRWALHVFWLAELRINFAHHLLRAAAAFYVC
jgi:hypothetical protein